MTNSRLNVYAPVEGVVINPVNKVVHASAVERALDVGVMLVVYVFPALTAVDVLPVLPMVCKLANLEPEMVERTLPEGVVKLYLHTGQCVLRRNHSLNGAHLNTCPHPMI